MAFARVETSILNHPKFVPLCSGEQGLAALGLWTLGLAYSMDQLSDGMVPKRWLRSRVHANRLQRSAEQLVKAGLWHDEGDHYLIHDYGQWNPSADQIKTDREAARERMRKLRGSPSRSPEQKTTFGRTLQAVRDKTETETETENTPPRTSSLVQANSKRSAADPIIRWTRRFGPLTGLHPRDRDKLTLASVTWPHDQLPPDFGRLWFRDGNWYPRPA